MGIFWLQIIINAFCNGYKTDLIIHRVHCAYTSYSSFDIQCQIGSGCITSVLVQHCQPSNSLNRKLESTRYIFHDGICLLSWQKHLFSFRWNSFSSVYSSHLLIIIMKYSFKFVLDTIRQIQSTIFKERIVSQHIEAETKWPPFSRRHFQMGFLEWKCMNFD